MFEIAWNGVTETAAIKAAQRQPERRGIPTRVVPSPPPPPDALRGRYARHELTAALLRVLADGRWYTTDEIGQLIGRCRADANSYCCALVRRGYAERRYERGRTRRPEPQLYRLRSDHAVQR